MRFRGHTLTAASLLLSAFAAGTMMATAAPVAAQQAPAEQDVYQDLFSAMIEATDREAELNNAMEAVRAQFEALPDFQSLEQISPGYIDDVITAMRPIMQKIVARSEADVQREYVKVFREEFTAQEAQELAAFWRNPLFKRMMLNASRNFVPEAMMADIETKDRIESEDLERDVQNAAEAAVSEMSLEELQALMSNARESEAWQKFVQVQPQILELRLKIENRPLTPDEELEMAQAMESVAEKHFGE